MKSTISRLATLTFLTLALPAYAAVKIDYVSVGDINNIADAKTSYGAVDHAFKIGKYKVTNSQYVEFLNVVDPNGTNPNGIYNPNMGHDVRGGINYNSNAAIGAKYTIRTNMGDKPVNYVSWYSAARFANWLNNGQGTGSTEIGAYTLSGNSGVPIRNSNAKVWVPSEDEWYKAAYFNPANSSYSLYPTQSNKPPKMAKADVKGAISNPGPNVINFFSGAKWNGQQGNVTTVGSAGAASASYYGTFDQGGNVWDWNDSVISGSKRGLRGGDWGHASDALCSTCRNYDSPSEESSLVGFRVASAP